MKNLLIAFAIATSFSQALKAEVSDFERGFNAGKLSCGSSDSQANVKWHCKISGNSVYHTSAVEVEGTLEKGIAICNEYWNVGCRAPIDKYIQCYKM